MTTAKLMFAIWALRGLEGTFGAVVDPNSHWGLWEGWGCSLAWWAKAFGNRSDIADVLFTKNTVQFNGVSLPGLGLNIARYNAGACSWNTVDNVSMAVSPNMIPARQIEGYWLDPSSSDPLSDKWNWSVDGNQRNMLIQAKNRGCNVFELFSNSPMWWMLENYNPSGSYSGSSDNLRKDQYKNFVTYMTTIAEYSSEHWGVDFDYIELFNEPMSNWWRYDNNQEGCHFAIESQSQLIDELFSVPSAAGKITASDENSYSLAIDTWTSFSNEIKRKVRKVNVHGYEYGGGRRDVLYDSTKGHVLWNSEYGEGDGSGKSLISNLNLDFRWLHPTAWHYWQPLDGGGWGLIQSDIESGWIGPVNKKYFALAHYSRHITRGMNIIDGGEVDTISAYDETTQKVVIVSSKVAYTYPLEVCYDFSLFQSVAGPISRWTTTLTNDDETYLFGADTVFNQSLSSFCFIFNSDTIATFEVEGVLI